MNGRQADFKKGLNLVALPCPCRRSEFHWQWVPVVGRWACRVYSALLCPPPLPRSISRHLPRVRAGGAQMGHHGSHGIREPKNNSPSDNTHTHTFMNRGRGVPKRLHCHFLAGGENSNRDTQSESRVVRPLPGPAAPTPTITTAHLLALGI